MVLLLTMKLLKRVHVHSKHIIRVPSDIAERRKLDLLKGTSDLKQQVGHVGVLDRLKHLLLVHVAYIIHPNSEKQALFKSRFSVSTSTSTKTLRPEACAKQGVDTLPFVGDPDPGYNLNTYVLLLAGTIPADDQIAMDNARVPVNDETIEDRQGSFLTTKTTEGPASPSLLRSLRSLTVSLIIVLKALQHDGTARLA